MPPLHPCESYVQKLLYDKSFDADEFMKSDFRDFFVSTNDYLELFAQGKDEGIFRKKKYVNMLELITAMRLIIQRSTPENYDRSIIMKLCNIFKILLHPLSSDVGREAAVAIQLELIKHIKEESIGQLAQAFYFTVPWYKFARDNEKESFEKFFNQNVYIKSNGKDEIIEPVKYINILKSFLAFLKNNWKLFPKDASRILFENILIIVYPEIAQSANLPPPPIGFNHPAPQEINSAIFAFFGELVQIKLDLKSLLNPVVTIFLVNLFTSEQILTNETLLTTLQFTLYICQYQEFINTVLGQEESLFLSLLKIANFADSHTKDKTILNLSNELRLKFISTLDEKNGAENGLNTISSLIESEQNQLCAVNLFLSGICYALQNSELSEKSIEFINRQISRNAIFSAALMKFARYMAVYSLPYLLNINKEEALKSSENYVNKTQRTRQTANYDWFARNCNNIYSHPQMTDPPVMTLALQKENNMIKTNVVPSMAINNQSNEYIERFLTILKLFDQEKDSNIRMRRFNVYVAFYSTLEAIRRVPPDIKSSSEIFFHNSHNILLKESNNDIDSFNLLDTILSSPTSRILTTYSLQASWKNSILEFFKVDQSAAIRAASNYILSGYSNAANLLDDLINASSQLQTISESSNTIGKLLPLMNDTQQNKVISLLMKWSTEQNVDYVSPLIVNALYEEAGDERKLIQTLIENAKKFTRVGSLSLLAALDEMTSNDANIALDAALSVPMPLQETLEQIEARLFFFGVVAMILAKTKTQPTKFAQYLSKYSHCLNKPEYAECKTFIETLINFVVVFAPVKNNDEYIPSSPKENAQSEDSKIAMTTDSSILHTKTIPESDEIILEHECYSGHFQYKFKRLEAPKIQQNKYSVKFDNIEKAPPVCTSQQAQFSANVCSLFGCPPPDSQDSQVPLFKNNVEEFSVPKPVYKPLSSGTIFTAFGIERSKLKVAKPNDDQAKRVVDINLEKLQATNYKYPIKAALIYVSEKVKTQEQILTTQFENTSPHFREFVANIGDIIDVQTHCLYDGGLDKSNAPTSPFFVDDAFEVILHTGPMMKNREDDNQQVYKKRHIGNDYITIVYIDGSAATDYNVQTITSQFNQVHILISTLPNGLFRVDSRRKNDVEMFGPLNGIHLVTKHALFKLVRKTVENAQVVLNMGQQKLSFPYSARRQCIEHVKKAVTVSAGSALLI